MSTKLWLENLMEGDHSESLGVHVRIILKRILKKQTGLIWLTIETGGGLL
jgi:hypothetical protein